MHHNHLMFDQLMISFYMHIIVPHHVIVIESFLIYSICAQNSYFLQETQHTVIFQTSENISVHIGTTKNDNRENIKNNSHMQ